MIEPRLVGRVSSRSMVVRAVFAAASFHLVNMISSFVTSKIVLIITS